MKRALFALTLVLFAACAARPEVKLEAERQAEVEQLFAGTEGCFLLYNLRTKSFESTFNKKYCYERSAPASTFKVPLAVMAADAGLVKSESIPFKWDGKDKGLQVWNADQTAASWIKNSAIWVSQGLTKKLGRKKVTAYLKKFSYGNRDFSGDLDAAWLTPAPFFEGGRREPRNSLKISPFEQVDFLEALWRDELPVAKPAQALARSLLRLEEAHGFALSGKTGSGYVGREADRRLGWFVAHVAGNGKEYLAVTRFEDREPAEKDAETGGQRAREITELLLRSAGLW